MKKSPTILKCAHRLIALGLALAVVNLSGGVGFAHSGSDVALGTLTVSGVVTVNDLRAIPGQTIFSSSHIVTASKSNSILELGNFTRVNLSEQTELMLDFSAAGISGSLRQGEIRAFMPAARSLSIITPDGAIETDSSQPVVFSVQVKTDATRIFVETGRVELRAGTNRRALAAGESFSMACGNFPEPANQQNLSGSGRVGIITGIAVGVAAILLLALLGDEPREMDGFGGCVIVPSGSNDGPGMCP